MAQISAQSPYNKRQVPADYNPGFFNVELGNIQRAIRPSTSVRVMAAYTATVNDDLILADASAAGYTVTLPDPARAHDAVFTIKKSDASANVVTIGATVDGVVNPTLATQYKSITVQSDGTTYWKLASV